MSRRALETDYLSLYRGSMRGTWREGSYTEISNEPVKKIQKTENFLYWGSTCET
jgi:hypothetical protein